MILAFELTMPNVGSWNGRWSGEGGAYIITKTFRSQQDVENAIKIRDKGYYHYSWNDGWGAGIHVSEVDSRDAAKLRKRSKGFCGYEWMVDTIIKYGKPLATHEIGEKV